MYNKQYYLLLHFTTKELPAVFKNSGNNGNKNKIENKSYGPKTTPSFIIFPKHHEIYFSVINMAQIINYFCLKHLGRNTMHDKI